MTRVVRARTVGVALSVIILVWGAAGHAHEPVFSPGPHTLYKGGLSTSVGTTVAVPGSGAPRIGMTGGLVSGLTADLNLAVSVPVAVERETHGGTLTGVADPVLQVKWRPWKSMAKGVIDSISLIGALKFPAGHHDLSAGTTGYVLGVTGAREHQRYYFFSSVRYVTQTVGPNGVKPGDVFMYDVATGVRPFVLEYDQPDAVILVELNGRTSGSARGGDGETQHGTLRQGLFESSSDYRTVRQAHTGGAVQVQSGSAGGTELAVSPELLLSWGPVMLKAGVQFPFFDTFEDSDATPNLRFKSSLIAQF